VYVLLKELDEKSSSFFKKKEESQNSLLKKEDLEIIMQKSYPKFIYLNSQLIACYSSSVSFQLID
jgi:hypothetical protein